MKRITEPRRHTGQNGLGHDCTTMRTAYVVEEKDVGKSKDNYLGYRQRGYTFTRLDVGRVLEVITEPGGGEYNCWAWGSIFSDVPKRVEVMP